MAKNKWMQEFDKVEGFVDYTQDAFMEGARSPSPSVNFIFGNTHLIPWGASVIFWGPPKGGKSLICNLIAGQVHKDYPEALVLKFNSEMREKFQMTERSLRMFGIDPDRYRARDSASAKKVPPLN
jgi:hypothetical protein